MQLSSGDAVYACRGSVVFGIGTMQGLATALLPVQTDWLLSDGRYPLLALLVPLPPFFALLPLPLYLCMGMDRKTASSTFSLC